VHQNSRRPLSDHTEANGLALEEKCVRKAPFRSSLVSHSVITILVLESRRGHRPAPRRSRPAVSGASSLANSPDELTDQIDSDTNH
jgi:hypothetical protein